MEKGQNRPVAKIIIGKKLNKCELKCFKSGTNHRRKDILKSGKYPSYPRKIALIGNYLPRKCGIATFSSDLLTALSEENPGGDLAPCPQS